MSSNTLLPLQGEPKKTTRKPRALPWAKCLLALQATLFLIIGFSVQAQAQTKKDYLVRIALNGGWTLKTGKTPDSYPLYYKDYLYNVKQGFGADVNAQFNLNNLFNIGLYYDYFRKSHSMPIYYTQNNQTYTWSIDNTYTLDFMAFSLGIQFTEGKSRYQILYLIGFMDYKESGNYSPYNNLLSNYSVGHCLGQGMMLNYDYMVNEHIALGVELTYCAGSIKEMNHQGHFGDPNNLVSETTPLGEPIRLNRVSPKVGFRYYL